MEENLKTILIVEDDAGLIELLADKMKDCGYHPISAAFASDAFIWVENHTPFLMILDYCLPDMNGKEFINGLKDRKLPIPPFVVSTGQGDERIAVEMMKLGASDYIIKDTHFLEMIPLVVSRVGREIEYEDRFRLTELALAESNQFNKQIIHSTREGIVVCDRDLRCQVWNPFVEELTGISESEVLGKSAKDLSLFSQEANIIKNIKKAMAGKFVAEVDIPFYIIDSGKSGWVSYTVASLLSATNDIVGAICTIRDITDRKLAEKALIESETRFRTLIEQAPVAINISRGRVSLYANKKFAEILGLRSVEESVGQYVEEYYAPQSRGQVSNSVLQLIQGNMDFAEFETIGCRADGSLFPMLINCSTVELSDGKAIITFLTDITERKKAEIAIIENQRLGAIGEMASSIAHDFNNSLQSILGNLELAMLQPELSESLHQYLTTIKTVAYDAAVRVKQIQRFGGKKVEPKFSHVDLNSLILDVVNQLRPLWKNEAEKKGLSIDVTTQLSEIPEFYGNDGEIRSALYNIVKNSIEAMPKGGNIILETAKTPDGISITVSDTGLGMDEKTKARVFQPFFTTKGFDLGRGLGMSGVYSIVKEHKGDIYVKKTVLGEGTSIEMVLPYTHQRKRVGNTEEVVECTSRMRVLWVEDNAIVRKVSKLMLENLNHEADVAGSGKEALEFLSKNEYDLVITDIGMPEMNGWQLADIIKDKFGGKMKVAVITGWSDEIDDYTRKEHGVDHILGKPFSIEQLKKLLDESTFQGTEKCVSREMSNVLR